MRLWTWLDRAGCDAARLIGTTLRGTAVIAQDKQPCRLDYTVICDASWRTQSARVEGWLGTRDIDFTIEAHDGVWTMNGIEVEAVRGAIDVDLNFSPSTNLLPIRRLQLAIGEEARVRAAWLRFPSFTLEPLEQVYRRVATDRYRYESLTGFTAELTVDADGFAIDYPGGWRSAE
jgi:uncharacterized protein